MHNRVDNQSFGSHQGKCQRPTGDPVLLVLHQKSSSTGLVGDWLNRHGYKTLIRRPPLGEKLPDNLEPYGGLIVFGGPMSANDDSPEIKSEIDWLTAVLEQGLPYFGICLGAQMMIRQLGGTVAPHAKGMVEIGYRRVQPTKAGTKLITDWPERFFQWHGEGFDLPDGTTALAHGTRFPQQAFCHGTQVFGVQFHPEVNADIIRHWSQSAAHMLNKKGAHLTQRLLHDHQKYKEGQRLWLDRFMSYWTSLIQPS